jgi:hypothetical protein
LKPVFGSRAAVTRPWTQVLALDWRPELRFLERRIELMRVLQEGGKMLSFRIDDREIAARFEGAELTMSLDGASLWVGRRTEGLTAGLQALGFALAAVLPGEVALMQAWLTHVIPLEGSYDELRIGSGRRLFPWWPADMTDYSVLIDGRARAADTNFQCEAGLVSREEILPRVNRNVGRTGRPTSQGMLEIDTASLPQVALFADSTWSFVPDTPLDDPQIFERATSFLYSATAEANELVNGLAAAVGSGE